MRRQWQPVTRLLAAAAVAVLSVTALLPVSPAQAAPTPLAAPVHLEFAVDGSIMMPTLAASGQIATGTLSADVDLRSGDMSGTAKLPDLSLLGALYGFIPTTIVLGLTETGAFAGLLAPDGHINASVEVQLAVRALKAFGSLALTSGDCRVADPLPIRLASDDGAQFRPATGGAISSTFSTGPLTGCGSLTDALNGIFPGAANRLSLQLTLRT